jgi:hypothetical protein
MVTVWPDSVAPFLAGEAMLAELEKLNSTVA